MKVIGALICFVFIQAASAEKCPSGSTSLVQCDQETKTCGANPSVGCLNINGTDWCCPKAVINKEDTFCFDTMPDCHVVKYMCDNPLLRPVIELKCSHTCGFCSEKKEDPEPEDPCYDRHSRCAEISAFCTDDQVTDMMTHLCKKSCGFCERPEVEEKEPSEDECFDRDLGLSQNPTCHDMFPNCTADAGWEDVMRTKCIRSCGICKPPQEGTAECTDISPDCSKIDPSICNADTDREVYSDELKSILYKQCRKLCGFCQKSEKPVEEEECRDSDPDCPMSTEYCTSNNKHLRDRAHKSCKKSCGLCGKPKKSTHKKPSHKRPKSQPAKGSCADTITYCERIKQLCSSEESHIKSDMFKKCRKSCGFCGGQQIKLEIPPAGK